MVLILANSCLHIHQSFSQEEINTAWNLVSDTLRSLARRGHPVEHTLDSLNSIHQLFFSGMFHRRHRSALLGYNLNLEDIAQSRLSEVPSAIREETQLNNDTVVPPSPTDIRQPSLGPIHHVNQAQERPHEVDFSGFQSFIDMATADMNLLPFCLNDDRIWNSFSGDEAL